MASSPWCAGWGRWRRGRGLASRDAEGFFISATFLHRLRILIVRGCNADFRRALSQRLENFLSRKVRHRQSCRPLRGLEHPASEGRLRAEDHVFHDQASAENRFADALRGIQLLAFSQL